MVLYFWAIRILWHASIWHHAAIAIISTWTIHVITITFGRAHDRTFIAGGTSIMDHSITRASFAWPAKFRVHTTVIIRSSITWHFISFITFGRAPGAAAGHHPRFPQPPAASGLEDVF